VPQVGTDGFQSFRHGKDRASRGFRDVQGAWQSLNQRDVGGGARWSRNRQDKERAGWRRRQPSDEGDGCASAEKIKLIFCGANGRVRNAERARGTRAGTT
jgi:hypothetical protein